MLRSNSPTAERVSEEVRRAVEEKSVVRIAGAGRWLHAGAPVAHQAVVSLAADNAIVEYVPGDLTLTAQAGATLGQIAATLANERQWLPLLPYGGLNGTIGATVATGSYGPLAATFGAPRDQVLGVEFVTGTGSVVRGGGRVTKNVAGFDLTRLMCGAWGTLGVITEVTVRLRGLPESDVTVALSLQGERNELGRLTAAMHHNGITPTSLEVLNAAAARNAGLPQAATLLARFCGNTPGVETQLKRIQSVAPTTPLPVNVWSALSDSDPSEGIAVRFSSAPSAFGDLWDIAQTLQQRFPAVSMQGNVLRGVLRILAPAEYASELAALSSYNLVCEVLPADLWPVLAPQALLSDELSVGVRKAFDPHHILNPGIL